MSCCKCVLWNKFPSEQFTRRRSTYTQSHVVRDKLLTMTKIDLNNDNENGLRWRKYHDMGCAVFFSTLRSRAVGQEMKDCDCMQLACLHTGWRPEKVESRKLSHRERPYSTMTVLYVVVITAFIHSERERVYVVLVSDWKLNGLGQCVHLSAVLCRMYVWVTYCSRAAGRCGVVPRCCMNEIKNEKELSPS